MFNNLGNMFQVLPYTLPALIFALSIHEFSHGMAAYWMGDDTAKNAGRLTLNPLRHLDPLGTLAVVFIGFGWAKPVPINPRNFKDFRRGIFYTSFAGPMSNFIQALIGVLLMKLVYTNSLWAIHIGNFSYSLATLLFYYIYINIILMIFNLIPLPPLDGSKIMYSFLSNEQIYRFQRNERTFQIILLALVFTGLIGMLLLPLAQGIINGLFNLFNLPTLF